MHANLLWARSILDQGWLNPNPHHPYADWMRGVGTPAEWLKWWGGAAIFQQSPLYAYLLAGFLAVTDDLLYVLMLQALLAASLGGLLGLITARITGRRRDGWLAFGLAGLYAPFYAYSQVLVRAGLSLVHGIFGSAEGPDLQQPRWAATTPVRLPGRVRDGSRGLSRVFWDRKGDEPTSGLPGPCRECVPLAPLGLCGMAGTHRL
jgi:hypothetical protein